MIYRLSPNQVEYILEKAHKRQASKKGVPTKKFDPKQSDLEIHEKGMAAELAFACMTQLKPNLGDGRSGDNGYDFATEKGLTIDVKFRGDRYKDLAFVGNDLRKFKADIAALLWPTENDFEYEFVGWTTRVAAAKIGRRMKFLGPRYVVEWRQLFKPESLMELL